MKHITPLIVFLLFSQMVVSQKLSVTEARQDYEVFKSTLVEAHPGIYRFEAKNTIDSLFQNAEAKMVDSISQQEFYQLLSPLVAAIHCGHTKFHPNNKLDEEHLFHYFYGTNNLFPLKLFFSGMKAYFYDSYDEKMDFEEGTEIISINDRPLSELIPFLLKNIPADGRVESYKYLELNNFFPAYYANLIDSPEIFRISLRNNNGEIYTVSVPAIPMEKIREYEKQHAQMSGPTFSLSFPLEQVAVMRIKAFYPLEKRDNFKKFLKRSFAEVESKNINRLIIDLRNNEGGNDRWGALLFSYLADAPFHYYDVLRLPNKDYTYKEYAQLPRFHGILKLFMKKDKVSGGYKWTIHRNLKIQDPQKNPFSGEVIILVNGFSFSVTAEFSAVAKASGRTNIYGQETGGAYSGNNSGTFMILTLPHSQLVLGIPLVGYYMAVPDIQPSDRGVLPDTEIIPDINQLIKGDDPVLEKALHNN